MIYLFKSGSVCDESTSEDVDGVEEIHSVATINNVQTSYFTQLKMCYLMTQERSGLFHSWYTDPSLQGKGEQCKSQVSHTDHTMEENHVIDWDKAKVVDREAQRQTRWVKEALWIRKTPMCMNRDAGSYQLSHTWDQVISRSRAPSSCKQSRRVNTFSVV